MAGAHATPPRETSVEQLSAAHGAQPDTRAGALFWPKLTATPSSLLTSHTSTRIPSSGLPSEERTERAHRGRLPAERERDLSFCSDCWVRWAWEARLVATYCGQPGQAQCRGDEGAVGLGGGNPSMKVSAAAELESAHPEEAFWEGPCPSAQTVLRPF